MKQTVYIEVLIITTEDLKGITDEKMQGVAKNAHEWYKGHNLEKTAELYVRVLNE